MPGIKGDRGYPGAECAKGIQGLKGVPGLRGEPGKYQQRIDPNLKALSIISMFNFVFAQVCKVSQERKDRKVKSV